MLLEGRYYRNKLENCLVIAALQRDQSIDREVYIYAKQYITSFKLIEPHPRHMRRCRVLASETKYGGRTSCTTGF